MLSTQTAPLASQNIITREPVSRRYLATSVQPLHPISWTSRAAGV